VPKIGPEALELHIFTVVLTKRLVGEAKPLHTWTLSPELLVYSVQGLVKIAQC
jgi:hypothetical protein